jgi:hypothetical protein
MRTRERKGGSGLGSEASKAAAGEKKDQERSERDGTAQGQKATLPLMSDDQRASAILLNHI